MKSKLVACTGCGLDRPVWKRLNKLPYCQGCTPKKGFTSKPPAPGFSTTRPGLSSKLSKTSSSARAAFLPSVSAKQNEANKAYSALRKVYLSDPTKQTCRAKLTNICTGATTDVHHSRGRGKKYLLDVSTWVPLCSACHHFLEEHPDQSRALGFTKSRLHEND